MNHSEFLKSLEDYLVEKRREFHRYPEVGFTEYVTTYRIVQELEGLDFELAIGKDALVTDERYGVPSDEVLTEAEKRAEGFGVPADLLENLSGGHTGVAAVLDTGKPGKHVAMRFDIDALPILESEDSDHVPSKEGFASVRDGEMHACGHDGHATIGLGVAKYLNAFKGELSGKFTLLFQPAEEGGRGAKAMVAKGWLDGVDYFMSGHLGIGEYKAGTVAATTSRFLASAKLNVHFHGKSAHAGVEPNAGKNALLAAASASLHLNSIPRHKDGATRVNVGTLEAGSGRNVIADTAFMQMETRGETTELNQYMQDQATRMIQASGDLYEVDTHIEFMGEALNGVCDEEFIEFVKEANQDNPYVKSVYDVQELGASEDVTFMMNRVQEKGGKATFMVFPSPLPAGHHHPKFDVDEFSLNTAVSTFVNLIRYLDEQE